MQRFSLLKRQCELDGCLTLKIAPAHPVEPTREEIEKVKQRAINNLCTYTPGLMPVGIDAKLLKGICELALKIKPKRLKLKVRHEKVNNKNSNRSIQKVY
jgi:hypothetical protein